MEPGKRDSRTRIIIENFGRNTRWNVNTGLATYDSDEAYQSGCILPVRERGVSYTLSGGGTEAENSRERHS